METIGSQYIMIPTTELHSIASQIINLIISHTTNQGTRKISVNFHSFKSEIPASHCKGVCLVPPSSKSASLTGPEVAGTTIPPRS